MSALLEYPCFEERNVSISTDLGSLGWGDPSHYTDVMCDFGQVTSVSSSLGGMLLGYIICDPSLDNLVS